MAEDEDVAGPPSEDEGPPGPSLKSSKDKKVKKEEKTKDKSKKTKEGKEDKKEKKDKGKKEKKDKGEKKVTSIPATASAASTEPLPGNTGLADPDDSFFEDLFQDADKVPDQPPPSGGPELAPGEQQPVSPVPETPKRTLTDDADQDDLEPAEKRLKTEGSAEEDWWSPGQCSEEKQRAHCSPPKETGTQWMMEGKVVEAKYGETFYEATILEISGETVKIRWHYNNSEEDVTPEALREKDEPMPPAEAQGATDPEVKKESFWQEPAPEAAEPEVAAMEADEELESAAKKVEVWNDESAWLVENDEKRVQRLTRIGRLQFKVKGNFVLLLSSDAGEDEASTAWAEACLQALRASRTGEDWTPTIASTSSLDPPVSVLDIPKSAKGNILGRNGSKLIQLSDQFDVIATFIPEVVEEHPEIAPGSAVQVRHREQWYDATAVSTEGQVKIKWPTGEEQEVERKDVRTVQVERLTAGKSVKAKYGSGYHNATVVDDVADDATIVKVKWEADGSEQELPKEEVQVEAAPKEETARLMILGACRSRISLILKALNILHKSTGSATYQEQPLEPGLRVLVKEVQEAGYLIGAKGVFVPRQMAATGAHIEYVGPVAHILGTEEECERAAALLDFIQGCSKTSLKKPEEVLDILKPICVQVAVPEECCQHIIGKKGCNLVEMGNELDVLICNTTLKPTLRPPAPGWVPAQGTLVEYMEGDERIKATFLRFEQEDSPQTAIVQRDNEEISIAVQRLRDPQVSEEPESRKWDEYAKLRHFLVFGSDLPRRRAAAFRVMGLVEEKWWGFYLLEEEAVDGQGLKVPGPGSGGEDPCAMEAELYKDHAVFNKSGPERWRRVGLITGCTVEKVGSTLRVVGRDAARARAWQYIRHILETSAAVQDVSWLLEAPEGTEDLLAEDKLPLLTAEVHENLEKETSTLIFLIGKGLEGHRLVICGAENDRAVAAQKLSDLEQAEPVVEWASSSWDSNKQDSGQSWGQSNSQWQAQEQQGWEKNDSWSAKPDPAKSSWSKSGEDDKWSRKSAGPQHQSSWGSKTDWKSEEKGNWDSGTDWKAKEGGSWDSKQDWKSEEQGTARGPTHSGSWNSAGNEWQSSSGSQSAPAPSWPLALPPHHLAAPASPPRFPAPPVRKSDPREVLQSMPRWPESVDEWAAWKGVIFAGFDPIPEPWVRVWSRSKQQVYYVRLDDPSVSTFDQTRLF